MTTPADEPAEPPAMKRANWLPAPAAFNLNAACVLVEQAFGGNVGVYLVGSSLYKRDYRDVDVRLMLDDKAFEALFPGSAQHPEVNPLWSLLGSSISCWLQKQTGLPIDFQIQQMTDANTKFPRQEGCKRHPLGLFIRPNPPDYARDVQLDDK